MQQKAFEKNPPAFLGGKKFFFNKLVIARNFLIMIKAIIQNKDTANITHNS